MPKSMFAEYDSTADNNTDVGGVDLAPSSMTVNIIDNALRELMSHIADHHARDTIASAGTTDLGSKAAHYLSVTGTTTITSFGTAKSGTAKLLHFAGALTLTHNATSLILLGGANITTAAGDMALVVSEGSGNWRMAAYQRADGTALVASINDGAVTTAKLDDNAVTPAKMEKGTLGDLLRYGTGGAPERLAVGTNDQILTVVSGEPAWADAPIVEGTAKAWVNLDGKGSDGIRDSQNVASWTDTGSGSPQINLTNAMSNTDFGLVVSAIMPSNATINDAIGVKGNDTSSAHTGPATYTVSSVLLLSQTSHGSDVDNALIGVQYMGDLA